MHRNRCGVVWRRIVTERFELYHSLTTQLGNFLQSSKLQAANLDDFAHQPFKALPVIDVGPLVASAGASSPADRLEVGRQLHSACRHVGFFTVVNHGVSENIYAGALAQARRWFALPEATKRQILLSRETRYRGYQPLGANVTRYGTQGGDFSRDWHEGIDLYREVPEHELHKFSPSPVHGLNPWPAQIPEFKAVLTAYINACLGLGATLMRGIAIGLGLPERTFEGNIAGDPYWVMRVINYPPLQQGDRFRETGGDALRALSGRNVPRSVQLSCGEHSDYGLLTIVNQEHGVTALQVQNAAGDWIDAVPVPGSFVCNIGDMLRLWTNGLYKPTMHRVVNATPDRSRISIPFFYEPNYDAMVEPLPEMCSPSEPKLPSVRYGKHLESKVLRNFEFQNEAQISETG